MVSSCRSGHGATDGALHSGGAVAVVSLGSVVSSCRSGHGATDGALHSGGAVAVVSLGSVGGSGRGDNIATCADFSGGAVGVNICAGAINRFEHSLASGADHIMLALADRSDTLFCVFTSRVNQLIQADRSITAGSRSIVAESQIGSVKAQFRAIVGCDGHCTVDQINGIEVLRGLIGIHTGLIFSYADVMAVGSHDGVIAIRLTLCDGNGIGIAGGNNAVSDRHILVVTRLCQGCSARTGSVKDLAGSRALLVNDQVSTGPVRRSSSDLLPSGVRLCVRIGDRDGYGLYTIGLKSVGANGFFTQSNCCIACGNYSKGDCNNDTFIAQTINTGVDGVDTQCRATGVCFFLSCFRCRGIINIIFLFFRVSNDVAPIYITDF